MDIKKEIIGSVASAISQKATDISTDLIFKGKINKKEVTLNRVGTGAAMTAAGVVLDSGSGFKSVLSKILRNFGMTSLAKSAIDTGINVIVKDE